MALRERKGRFLGGVFPRYSSSFFFFLSVRLVRERKQRGGVGRCFIHAGVLILPTVATKRRARYYRSRLRRRRDNDTRACVLTGSLFFSFGRYKSFCTRSLFSVRTHPLAASLVFHKRFPRDTRPAGYVTGPRPHVRSLVIA